jgi:hypothetical protein
MNEYKPKVNDYVIWHTYPTPISGWVYFADKSYITIEMGTSPKDDENIRACPIHKNNHILVVCYPEYWNQLEYVKSRKSIYDQEEEFVEMVGKSTGREGIEE